MSKYTLKVAVQFSAAHKLHGYIGKCSRLHGHNWTVEAEIIATKLDHIGIGIDFSEVKKLLKEEINLFDHQNLNEIAPFDTINPTAENLAAHFFHQLQTKITKMNCELAAITIWETTNSSVRYSLK